jgi:PAS domain S-box-containing protein
LMRMTKVAVESANEVYVNLCKETSIRVLHVDDDAGFLAVAKQCLEEQSQFEVDTALSAEEALKKLRDSEYDVVVTDYQMPGKNGLELLRELRQEGNDVPFILFTCKGKEEIAITALNSGVYRYVGKEGKAEATYAELKRSICDAVRGQRAEKLLREAKNQLRLITENMQDMLLITDANLICTFASASHRWILGYEPSEMIGKNIYDFIHPDDMARAMEAAKKAFKDNSGGTMEVRVRRADGSYILSEGIGKILTDENGQITGTMFTSRDITESKKISEKTRLQARLLNSVGQAIIATDLEGNITYWNRAAEQLYGWKEAEVLGRNIVNVTPAETSQEQAINIMNRLIEGEYWSGEFIAKRRDGTIFPAIVTNSPITNDKGEIIGVIGISTDITEQKWMQEVFDDAIGKVVELNEKLRVVEGLTRHDIRNKLSALNGRLYLLKKRFGDNPEAQQHLKEMESVSQQMLRIIEFEKIYVQVGAEELSNIDVERHLNEATFLFSDLKGATLVNECQGLMVLADSLLRQLFYNLIDNTLKYGKKTRRIRVHYKEEKNQLKLIYEDDGVGIPNDIKSHLFQKGYGTGTGYGLYLIKRICEAYGWTIEETGKEGQGAQFTIIIPKENKDGKKGYVIS